MERILVGIDAEHPSNEALLRALRLAPRIQASVDVLVVFAPGHRESAQGEALLRRIEAALEAAAIPGARARLFVAEGSFDKEVVAAAGLMKTTLLVAGAPAAEDQGQERETEGLYRIFNSVDCRMELVSPKPS